MDESFKLKVQALNVEFFYVFSLFLSGKVFSCLTIINNYEKISFMRKNSFAFKLRGTCAMFETREFLSYHVVLMHFYGHDQAGNRLIDIYLWSASEEKCVVMLSLRIDKIHTEQWHIRKFIDANVILLYIESDYTGGEIKYTRKHI